MVGAFLLTNLDRAILGLFIIKEVNVKDRIQGILPVVQTALTDDGMLDEQSMETQVEFCIEAAAHGIVYPVLGSEYQFLSDKERQHLVEVVVGAAAGAIPVIAGVASSSTAAATEHAAHASRAGASAVIAMPPFISVASPDEIFEYYRAIASAADMPVIIQHAAAGPGVDAEFLKKLLSDVDQVRYIKEEMDPSAHNISSLLAADIPDCWGVFGGGWCRWMMSELERGANGFMPSVEVVDIHMQIWDAFQSGNRVEARRIFDLLAPFIHLTFNLGLPFVKQALVHRGIIRSARMRQPGSVPLDEADLRELEAVIGKIEPLFMERN